MTDHRVYVEKLIMIHPSGKFNAGFCFCEFPSDDNIEQLVDLLHPQERSYYETLTFQKRIKSFLIGRFAAKKAIAAMAGTVNLPKILIQTGIFTQPIVTVENHSNIQVSISHSENSGIAIAFPELHPMGIDIERIRPEQSSTIEHEVTESELKQIRVLPITYDQRLTLLWTVKEGLSKVLKTGLMTPFKIYEVNRIECLSPDYFYFTYKNFIQYKTISFIIGDYACSITYPLKTEFSIDLDSLRAMIDKYPCPDQSRRLQVDPDVDRSRDMPHPV